MRWLQWLLMTVTAAAVVMGLGPPATAGTGSSPESGFIMFEAQDSGLTINNPSPTVPGGAWCAGVWDTAAIAANENQNTVAIGIWVYNAAAITGSGNWRGRLARRLIHRRPIVDGEHWRPIGACTRKTITGGGGRSGRGVGQMTPNALCIDATAADANSSTN